LRKREQWTRYAELLIEGVSLREAARRCQIDKNTAFLWRHRFLHDAAGHRAEHEAGIVEADETFFLESFKGQRRLPRPARHRGGVAGKRGLSAEQIPVLVVRDRSGQTADFKLEKLDAEHVIAALRTLVDPEAILCSDSAGVYAAFARATGISHRPLNIQHGPRVVDGVFHIQNVNAYDSRLKGWMRRFHGVATKYLENYLGWRRMLERYKTAITPKLCLAEAQGRPINS
jgi:transposase-like protein